MAPHPAPSLLPSSHPFGPTPALGLRHRGFDFTVQQESGGSTASFGYAIAHQGLVLHTSGGAFRTPQAADRAARQFVDDALSSFEYALTTEDRVC